MNYSYKLKRIALTGATSTLGTAIIRECIKKNIEVVAFVNNESVNESRIPQSKLVTKRYCSLQEMADYEVKDLWADAFFHLAWGHTNRAVRNELKPQIENIKYSIDSVRLADAMGCKVYVGAGSQAEYGKCDFLLNEDSPTNPETAYGMAKLCSGQMTRLECKKRGIRHVWPRIFSTYGPNTQDSTILNYTISHLLKEEKPSLTACDQIWDFLYVDDAARALLLLAEHGKDGEVYCIASGKCKTLKDFVLKTRSYIETNVEIGFGEIPYSENTVMHLAGDISKLQTTTGFVPQISFEEGIQKTIEWAREYYHKSAKA